MRNLILAPRFHPVLGGYEYYLFRVARALLEAGQPVQVFTTNAYDQEYFWCKDFRSIFPLAEELDGLRMRRFPIVHRKWRRRASRLLSFLPSTRLRALYARPAFSVASLSSALQEAAFDQIHLGPLPHSGLIYSGIRAAYAKKARIVATPATHLGPADSDVVRRFYVRRFQIDLLNRCHRILVSTRVERDWLTRLGVKPEKLALYSLGIDIGAVTGGNPSDFRERHQIFEPFVLFLGTKAFEKGVFHLVKAMASLWKRGHQTRLVLAGPTFGEFSQFLREQPGWVRGRIHDIGIISENEKRDLLAATEVLALPSRVESFGLVYLEAWANKKPVIAANIPAVAEVVSHGVDGLRVEFGDTEGLARSLEELLENPSLRQKMGHRGWQRTIVYHTWEKCWEQIAPHFGVSCFEQVTIP